ncbi:MAG: hypothetical protein PHS62_04765 [Patescibacteria group bacterium]|nr:hypothetical protein [Patescibacteria group bacterium]
MSRGLIKFYIIILAGAALILSAQAPSLAADDSAAALAQVAEQQQALERQLKDIESQIGQYQKELKSIKGQKNTLINKITRLQKKQAALTLQIKATALKVEDLAGKITATIINIDQTSIKRAGLKEQIGRVLELIYEQDNYTLLYLLATRGNLMSLIDSEASYNQVIRGLDQLLKEAQAINEQLNQQKTLLNDQQEETENLLSIQELQRHDLADSAKEQDNLLKQTKGKESNYQKMLSDSQKEAQAIKSRMYQLLEVAEQINFGQAVSIASWASAQSGVRAAFLLSVLTQESNLGKNVGTCNRAGDPPEKSWKVVMNPTRDQPKFLIITDELKMNPDVTPISCPMRDKNGNRIGWGGAMGPAQFIPSTWLGYKDKVSAVTGKPANPWDIRDAFLAAAIKLAAGGATAESGEWAAAMRYFSGSTNAKYSFYGDSVVARAEAYQEDIDKMNK